MLLLIPIEFPIEVFWLINSLRWIWFMPSCPHVTQTVWLPNQHMNSALTATCDVAWQNSWYSSKTMKMEELGPQTFRGPRWWLARKLIFIPSIDALGTMHWTGCNICEGHLTAPTIPLPSPALARTRISSAPLKVCNSCFDMYFQTTLKTFIVSLSWSTNNRPFLISALMISTSISVLWEIVSSFSLPWLTLRIALRSTLGSLYMLVYCYCALTMYSKLGPEVGGKREYSFCALF